MQQLTRIPRNRLIAAGAATAVVVIVLLVALAQSGRPSGADGPTGSAVAVGPTSSASPPGSASGGPSPSGSASGSPSPSPSVPGAPATPPVVPATPGPTEPGPPLGLEVVESGFTAFDENGLDVAAFGALIRNPNPDRWQLTRATVHVDFYAADETLLGSTDVFLTIEPGRTVAIAGETFGAGRATRIDIVLPDDLVAFGTGGRTPALTIEGVETVRADGLNRTTGELVNRGGQTETFVELAALYRNGAGRIVGGATGAVESIAAGQRVAFELLDSLPFASIASTEVHWRSGG